LLSIGTTGRERDLESPGRGFATRGRGVREPRETVVHVDALRAAAASRQGERRADDDEPRRKANEAHTLGDNAHYANCDARL
jgi:hypothetical protein